MEEQGSIERVATTYNDDRSLARIYFNVSGILKNKKIILVMQVRKRLAVVENLSKILVNFIENMNFIKFEYSLKGVICSLVLGEYPFTTKNRKQDFWIPSHSVP